MKSRNVNLKSECRKCRMAKERKRTRLEREYELYISNIYFTHIRQKYNKIYHILLTERLATSPK